MRIITDARVYATLMKADPAGLPPMLRTSTRFWSLELMGISENLGSEGTVLCWCDSDRQWWRTG